MNKQLLALALVLALGTTYAAAQYPSSQPSASTASTSQASTDVDSKLKVDDQTLTSQIHQQLQTDAALKNVQINVVSGQVDLSGTVPSKDDRKRAKEMASAVPGVRSVREHLTIGGAAANATGNTATKETEHNTAGSIAGNSDATTASATGQSTAAGTPSNSGSMSAAQATGAPQIVSGVDPTSASIATNGVKQAIHSDTQLASQNIIATVNEKNEIVLSGTVASDAVKQHAEAIAQKSAGNRPVVNQIAVSANQSAANHSASSTVGSATGEASAQNSSIQTAGTAGATAGQAGTGGITGSATATGTTTDKSSATSNTGTMAAPTAGTAAGTSGQSSTTMQGQTGAAGTAASDTAALKSQLDSAYQSEPTLSSSHVMVNVTDTNIELTGTVPTAKERLTAKRIAQSYAGNRKVDEKLTVTGHGPSSGNNPGMGQTGASNSTDMNTGMGTNTSTTGTTPTTKDPSSNPPASNNDTPKAKGDQTTESPK